jgi:phosphatidylinositol alpha-1,6-mannosyltransferase
MPSLTEIHISLPPEPIRFLVMADSYLPHSGGSRVYYANLYKNLLEQYPDTITLLTKKVPGWCNFDAQNSNLRFQISRRCNPLPNWKYGQLPKALPQLAHALTKLAAHQYDCMHCCDLFPQALNGALLSAMFRLPLLVFCHGDEISQTDKRRFQPRVRDFLYRQADALVAANQFAKDGLLRIGIASNRIHKVTPGVDLEHFRPGSPSKHLVDRFALAGRKVILTVARLVPRKGHRIVLEALSVVSKRIPNLKYLIAGEGPEKERLQQMVRELHLEDVVTFVGDVPHHQIAEFYRLCDIFVMINRLEAGGDVESFGMVFTEANAMGKVVIGGRSGGTAEAVLDGTTGFLVDPESAANVADRLLLLLSDNELARGMGLAGLKRVIHEFGWKSRADTLRQISAELVSKRRGTAAAIKRSQPSRPKASY